jgi:hypothetical protein
MLLMPRKQRATVFNCASFEPLSPVWSRLHQLPLICPCSDKYLQIELCYRSISTPSDTRIEHSQQRLPHTKRRSVSAQRERANQLLHPQIETRGAPLAHTHAPWRRQGARRRSRI